MPRTANYDVTKVLSQAIDVFLEFSFHGAIMDDIIARTGFNRRAFYLEFGSKQTFLYRVLEHYQQTQLFPVLVELEARRGMISIEHFFNRYIRLIHGRGCLLINCISELGKQDDTVRNMGRHYLDRLQLDFIGCLERAQHMQEMAPGVNIESTALQLTSYVQGFAVTAVVADSAEEMQLATATLLTPIKAG